MSRDHAIQLGVFSCVLFAILFAASVSPPDPVEKRSVVDVVGVGSSPAAVASCLDQWASAHEDREVSGFAVVDGSLVILHRRR